MNYVVFDMTDLEILGPSADLLILTTAPIGIPIPLDTARTAVPEVIRALPFDRLRISTSKRWQIETAKEKRHGKKWERVMFLPRNLDALREVVIAAQERGSRASAETTDNIESDEIASNIVRARKRANVPRVGNIVELRGQDGESKHEAWGRGFGFELDPDAKGYGWVLLDMMCGS